MCESTVYSRCIQGQVGVGKHPTSHVSMQVQRRIRENDATLSSIKAAQSVDRNLGRPAASLQFSWQMRHSASVARQRASASRFLSSTGEPAPPISGFWSRGGTAPNPNADACALARLFWRNPASARPPAPWTPAEKLQLRQAIRNQVVVQHQSHITSAFHQRVNSGESAAALKPELLEKLAALKNVHADDPATLEQAEQFSRKDWHAVAQQLHDRCSSAVQCRGMGYPCGRDGCQLVTTVCGCP